MNGIDIPEKGRTALRMLSALSLFYLLNCVCATDSSAEGTLKSEILKDQGIEREYLLYLPETLSENAPLVIVLHGHGGRAMKGGEAFCGIAEEEGFAVCYPQGIEDSTGKTCWNVGYPFQAEMKTDDVKFLCRLVRKIVKEYSLDSRNVFCTGMSNGGEMCYLLAYLRPDVFTAVAPVAGLTLEWMYRDLKPRRHIPLMEVHGTDDKTSFWNGDPENRGGWGEYIAVPQATGLWIAEARCTHEICDTLQRKRNPVILHRFVNGLPMWEGGPSAEVRLYEIRGGGHSWAEKDMDTCRLIWEFFSQYLR